MRETTKSQTITRTIQEQLSEKILGLFDIVINERQAHYQKNPDAIPDANSIEGIISKYSNINMGISGGLSLIPGPWGLAAVAPEILLVITNQLMMIYDLGMAYGKSKVLCKELLAGVFVSTVGMGGIGLLAMHGGKVLVRRTSLRVFQRIMAMMAASLTQQMLKSAVSKFIPVLGAAAMAAWSRYLTVQLGKKAVEVFSKPIEISNEEVTEESLQDETVGNVTTSASLDNLLVAKIDALTNLMKVDGNIADKELEYLEPLIANVNLESKVIEALRSKLRSPDKATVDYSLFKKSPEESLGLMMDLIALAKRDCEFHPTEKIYIKQIGKQLGYADDDIAEMLAI